MNSIKMSKEWDKTFPKSDKVEHKNILRLVVKKSPTGESTHYFFHSQDDKVEVSC